MTLADTAGIALGLTAVLAVTARLAGALTTSGAVAGALVGACVAAGFGLPGLAVLGTFFVVGTLATRIGWQRKKARGTAEAGEGRRDAKRVLGKGGVAAAIALLWSVDAWSLWWGSPDSAFAGAVAAALADTLGTEIGTLSAAGPRALPSLRRVPSGTPGAVSLLGVVAAAVGAALVANVAWMVRLVSPHHAFPLAVAIGGLAGSLLESVAVGAGLRASGPVRNVLTTLTGALIAGNLFIVRTSVQ